jgi:hypothetical protein
MRTTQRKGDTAVAQAISTFTREGMDILIPLTESAAYDLAVDDNGAIFRIQVKYTSSKEVDLRSIHSNSNGYIVKKSQEQSYDWLYILSSDGYEYLYKNCLFGRRSVKPDKKHIIRKGGREV